MALTSIGKFNQLDDLDAWGQITDLGGEVLDSSSNVNVFGKMSLGAPTDEISSGYFGTEKGKYRLVYPFSEQAVIIVGEVAITDESTGITTTFKAGDLWVVEKGTSTIWEVKSDFFIKHYFAVV
ncbi:cupin domain-containing protein [Acinetobacter nosocomialis]|uniref:cupin domain-containing protein n=1 Tax=Acinetobacter nosocomialis TaxID=106654 RepID=UPI0026EB040E|nr:cupin domain-containing protein [Acinetobacter nosocomialis]MDO7210439.1 cupin domain-containing protein [Acinetobacter nosocomialis]